MDYAIFAIGPNGEQIYNDSNGKCYFLNNRGGYEPLRFEEMSSNGNSSYTDVTTSNFSNSGSFYINGQIISPSGCSYPNSETGQKQSSDSLNQVGGHVTTDFGSLVSRAVQRSLVSGSVRGGNVAFSNANMPNLTSSSEGNTSVASSYDFTIDSEEQDSLSSQLDLAADSFEQKVNLMYREIGNMANYWVGEDYDAYCQATDGYKKALGDLSDSIRMYGKHFEKMSNSTEELTNELIEIVETCTSRHVR